MSTRVGTLQAPRASNSILLAVFLGSLVMLTIAVVAISFANDQGRQGETTFVGGTLANTPSELNQSGWSSPPASRHKVMGDTLGSNTPTELSGGIIGGLPAKFYDRHQRG